MTKLQHKQIIVLYLNAQSAPDIAKRLNLPLQQIYRSLKHAKIPRRKATEQNRLRFEKSAPTYQIKKPVSAKEKKLQTAGLMLYWGEGAKTGNTVDMTNSSPLAIYTFVTYLRKICQIRENKLKFYLYCFSNQNLDQLIGFWSKLLGVSNAQFTKPHVRQVMAGKTHRIAPWGVIHARYSDKKLLTHILRSCEQLMREVTTI